MEVWLLRARSWWRVVLVFFLTLGSVTPGHFASAGDLDADTEMSKSLDETSSSRRSWEQHVREEKRRIQELATQRRTNRSHDPVVPLSEEDRLASERALNDMTLERGDIGLRKPMPFMVGWLEHVRNWGGRAWCSKSPAYGRPVQWYRPAPVSLHIDSRPVHSRRMVLNRNLLD
jgi:hypothetical protein